MKVVHSWLREYLGDALPDVGRVEDLLTFHAFEIDGVEEVNGEMVIDVDVLPNRASDCLSHRGIARELAAQINTTLVYDPLRTAPDLPKTDKIKITIEDATTCSRFSLSLLEGVAIKESPAWLKERLVALGQRPINNIVDATNYVMYALGQPMHAYDADKFPKQGGQWQFVVRTARAGETVSLLAEGGKDEDRVVELLGTELLIVDGSSDTPVGLAGIKGGRAAELTADTRNIIIEAAHFAPAVIRKTARRLGILTDASKRFENDPARELALYAQAEIVRLITDMAGGALVGVADEYPIVQQSVTTLVRVERVNALLGTELTQTDMVGYLVRIGAEVEVVEDGVLRVTAPWERNDLNIEADYIEEVGRIHGLSGVVSVVPEAVPLAEINKKQYYSEQVRHLLMELGFSEVITSSFLKKAEIQLQNALASDKSYVRNTLIKNITAVLDANFNHCDLLGMADVRVFEIGTVFDKTNRGVSEHTVLTLGVRSKGNGYSPQDDKLLLEVKTKIASVLDCEIPWQGEKGVVETNFTEVLETLPVPLAYEPYQSHKDAVFKRPSAYPAMSRDIALFVAGGDEAHAVEETLRVAAGALLARIDLFDTFTKDERTSYAFRLVFQSYEKTLTDEEVNAVMEVIYAIVKDKGWEVR